MQEYILLSLFLSSLASASSNSAICGPAKKHFPYQISKIEYFEIDLDGNNRKDLFVTDGRGNAGAQYKVLLNQEIDYVIAGEIFVHPLGFQLIKNKNSSVSSILAYIRDGADFGNLVTYVYSGKKYLKTKSERIPSSDFGKRITPLEVKVSETICE